MFLINMSFLLIYGLFNGIVITLHYIKGKVVPIKHYTLKTGRSACIDPHVPDLGTNGQLHIPATLLPGKEPPVPIE